MKCIRNPAAPAHLPQGERGARSRHRPEPEAPQSCPAAGRARGRAGTDRRPPAV